MFLVLRLVNFLSGDNAQTDRQTTKKRHYESKHIHMHMLILLNTYKTLENIHSKVINYSKK